MAEGRVRDHFVFFPKIRFARTIFENRIGIGDEVERKIPMEGIPVWRAKCSAGRRTQQAGGLRSPNQRVAVSNVCIVVGRLVKCMA